MLLHTGIYGPPLTMQQIVPVQFRKQHFINSFLVLFLSKLLSCFRFPLFFKDFVLIVLNTQVKTFFTYCYIILQSLFKLLSPFKYPFPFTIQYISSQSYIIYGIHFHDTSMFKILSPVSCLRQNAFFINILFSFISIVCIITFGLQSESYENVKQFIWQHQYVFIQGRFALSVHITCMTPHETPLQPCTFLQYTGISMSNFSPYNTYVHHSRNKNKQITTTSQSMYCV